MTRSINTYNELLARETNLEQLLQVRRQLIRLNIDELKQEAAPLIDAANTVSEFFTRDHKAGLLGIAANMLIDTFVRKKLLAGSGWVAKLLVPVLIKNYSSHFIASYQEQWMQSLAEWFGSGKNDTDQYSDDDFSKN